MCTGYRLALPDVHPVKIDANQLELALMNLAVNARDAMPKGGSLTIRCRDETTSGLNDLPKALPRGDYVRISVADTGEGMTETTLAKAMEPFFTTKGIGKGTGLGLSMVHGLTAQSGPNTNGGSMIAAIPLNSSATLSTSIVSPASPAARADDLRIAGILLGTRPVQVFLIVRNHPEFSFQA
jgi:K+-sensing histidine kinase KdpD